MATRHASALKQARQAIKHRVRNRAYMSRMKTAIRHVNSATEKTAAETAFRSASKLLDQLASKGLIHRNKAANQKSSLSKFVAAIK